MSKSMEFEGIKVDVIYAPRLKHSYLRVNADSTLSVKTPVNSSRFIQTFLEEKRDWIDKQLRKNEQNMLLQVKLQDEVLLFGTLYSIDAPEVSSLRQKLTKLSTSEIEKITKAYDAFYKRSAEEYLSDRVKYFSNIMGLSYEKLKFRKMKSRWGSCSSKREITLNTQLMKIDKELIDYVIVHELSHLVHMNHSKAFHDFVESHLSGSKALRKKLKDIRLLE